MRRDELSICMFFILKFALLQIHSEPARLSIKNIEKDDKGMYQCFVSNEWEQIQSTAELQLGGEYWLDSHWFIQLKLIYRHLFSLFHWRCIAWIALLVLRADASARTNRIAQVYCDRKSASAVRLDSWRISSEFFTLFEFLSIFFSLIALLCFISGFRFMQNKQSVFH